MPSGKFSKVDVGFRLGNLEVTEVHRCGGVVRVVCHCHTCGVTGYENEINEIKKRHKKLKARRPDEMLSCSCQSSRLSSEAATKQDPLHAHKSYHVWRMMMVRCYRENYPAYKNYGARGINVCDRWHVYENFVADMGEPPHRHDLERMDNSKGYSPDNCGWRTRRRNCNNRRVNVHVVIKGTKYTVSQAARKFKVGRSTLAYRIANGEDASHAVSYRSKNEPRIHTYGGMSMTTTGWAEHWGVHPSTAHKRLKRLINEQEDDNAS